MHRKLCTLALSGFLVLGVSTGAAFAQDDTTPPPQPSHMHGHHRMDPDHQLRHMTKELDLSADQQAQIKPVLESRQEQMQQIRQDQSLSQQDRRQKMMDIQQDTSSKIEAALNDTQKQKYEAMQAKMRNRRMHRGGMGGDNPPPPDSGEAQPNQ